MTILYKDRKPLNWKKLLVVQLLAALVLALVSVQLLAAISVRSSTQNAMATIRFIGTGTFASCDGCAALNPSTPQGTPSGNTGDLLIATVNVREEVNTITVSAGWTAFYSNTYGGGQDFQAHLYRRIADGSANDNLTVTQSNTSESFAARIVRFRGVDTTNPILAGPAATKQNSDNLDTPTISTSGYPNAMLVVSGLVTDDSTVTEDPLWNPAFESTATAGRDLAISLHYKLQLTAGLKSISNWALSNGADENYGIIYALRPATQLADGGPIVPIVSHVGAGSFAEAQGCGAGNAINPSTPAGNIGDLLIASINARDDGATISVSAGWTLLYSDTYGGQDFKVALYRRIANGTATDNITVTQTGTCNVIAAQISRFSGVDTTSPIVAGPAATKQNSDNIDTPTINTTPVAEAMLVVSAFINDNRTVTEGAGWSESFDTETNTGRDLGMSLHYQLQSTAGNKSISNWDIGGTDENYGIIYALRPAPSTVSTSPKGLTINVPAGTTVDDVMIAVVSIRPSTMNVATPAGWTLRNTITQAAPNTSRQYVFSRVVTGAEPPSYNWALSGTLTSTSPGSAGGAGAAGGIVSFIGVDTTSPFDVLPIGNTTPSGTSHTANQITTTVINAMVVSAHSFTSTMPWTPPAGMTEHVDIGTLTTTNPATTNALGLSLEMATVIQAATGLTGNKTATVAGNADTGIASLMALRPIPSGATVFTPASGGGSISADTNSTSGSGTYTGLTGLDIRETNIGGMLVGDYTLTAPAGFQFDTGTNVTITVNSLGGAGTNLSLVSTSVTPAASTITFTVATVSTGTRLNSLTFANLWVRPTADCPLATTGNIIYATSTITTITSNNAGTLTEVTGTATDMYTVLPGQTPYDNTSCGTVSGVPVDQTINIPFNISQLVVTDQFGNIDLTYDNAGVAINYVYSGPGTPSFTNPVNFTDGVATTVLVTTLDTAATNVTITADDGSLNGVTSAQFNVNAFSIPASVATYYMDESSWDGTADEVTDSSGNNLHGVSINGPDTSNAIPAIPGDPGTCNYGVFDQIDDLLQVADDPLLDITNTLTVTSWIYTFTWPAAGLKTILSKDTNYEYHLNPAGQVFWWWNGGPQSLTSASSIPLNEWHHIAIVYNGNGAGSGIATIYIDGVANATTNDGVGTLSTNANPLEIAADQAFPGRNFDGWIDEVRIFDQVLNGPQINLVMNDTRPCTTPPTLPTLVANWRLDFADVNPITDSSGNGLDGTQMNVLKTSPGLVCDAADLTADSNTDYIEVPASAMDTLTDFSISVWARTNNTGEQYLMSGANTGDDDELQWWFENSTDFRPTVASDNNNPGPDEITIPDIADGLWHHLVWTRSGTNNCIYVDTVMQGCVPRNSAALDIDYLFIGQEQDTPGNDFNNNDDWEGDIDEVLIYSGVLSAADVQTINLNHLAGLNVDGTGRNCPVVQYNVVHDGTGLSCLSESVTFTAIDAHGNTTDPGNVTINLSVSPVAPGPPPAKGNWARISAGSGTLSNQLSDGTADYLFPGNGESSTTLLFNYTVLETGNSAETINFDVDDVFNNVTDARDNNGVTDPNLVMSLTGFQFYNEDTGDETIPTQIAGKPSDVPPNDDTLTLRAIRVSDDDPMVCTAAFPDMSVVTVPLGAECLNPGTCAGGREMRIINNSITTVISTNNDNAGAGTSAYTNVNLLFEDIGGVSRAELVVNYPDAGRVQLHGRYEIPLDETPAASPPAGSPSGGFMEGSSQAFIVRPFALAVTDILAGATPNPGTLTVAAANEFTSAGSDFSVSVGAYLWAAADDDGAPWGVADDGIPDSRAVGSFTEGVDITDNNALVGSALAPSFGWNGSLSAIANYAPAGGALGALINGAVLSTDFSGGEATIPDVQYLEVGTFMMEAQFDDYLGDTSIDLVGASYWNGQLDSAGNPTGAIGRFIPYDFDISVSVAPEFGTVCSAFTYIGQPFVFTTDGVLTVTARAEGGATTTNYTGSFNRLSTASLSFPGGTNEGFLEGSPGALGLDTGLISGWSPALNDLGTGLTDLSFSFAPGEMIAFNRLDPVVPFDAEISLGINVVDDDGVFYGDGAGLEINPAQFGDTGAGLGIAFDADKDQRWGRLAVNNATGSELLDLSVPLVTEYWNGTGFTMNTDDNCTLIDALATGVSLSNPDTGGGVPQPGTTAMIITDGTTSITSGPPAVTAGVAGMVFSAPDDGDATADTGYVDIEIILDVTGSDDPWLQFDWDDVDGLGDGPYDTNPTGRVTFGIYNGPMDFIYIREPW